MTREYKRIIVARTDKIGDLILSIPSFFMLRQMYPKAEITLLVRGYNYDIVKNLSYIDRIIRIDDYRQKELLEKIEYFNADLFIALYVDKYILKLVKASKAKVRIGPLSKLKSFLVFNKGVLQKRSKSIKNEAEYNLDLIKKVDKKRYEEAYKLDSKIYLGLNNIKAANKFLLDNHIGDKLLVINPFMGGSAKNITDEQYANIIKKVKAKVKDVDIVITTHISDEERGNNLIKLINMEKVYLFANGGELLNIGGVIARAKLYFGGSTGPTHIAGALQKSIVAVYPKKKTQNPIRWGVFNNSNVVYIIPDELKKESYKTKNFTSYDEQTENKIVMEIIKGLEKE